MDKATLDAIGEFLNEELVKIEARLVKALATEDRAAALVRAVESQRVARDISALRRYVRNFAHTKSRVVKHLGGIPGAHLRALDAQREEAGE